VDPAIIAGAQDCVAKSKHRHTERCTTLAFRNEGLKNRNKTKNIATWTRVCRICVCVHMYIYTCMVYTYIYIYIYVLKIRRPRRRQGGARQRRHYHQPGARNDESKSWRIKQSQAASAQEGPGATARRQEKAAAKVKRQLTASVLQKQQKKTASSL